MSPDSKVVVVGVDGSDASIEALRWAVNYSKETGAKVRAVATWHYPWAMQTAPQQVDKTVAERVGENLKASLDKAGVDGAVEEVVLEGHPAIALVKESAAADLLVVGSHGHSAVRDLLLGSVSLHCVTNSVCPVVVVRRK
jgi:nucleotide-binding universal stress UspA family protein